jgi:hypothetical protein
MTNGEEIATVIWRTLSEISKKEKEKAIQSENYEDALIASFFEGFFRELKTSLANAST